MEFYEYFQSHRNYFWQWEDNAEVIAIPNENTIAYRDFVIQIFEKLQPQGIPPFGSLLLAIIATNPNGHHAIYTVHAIVSAAMGTTDDIMLADAFDFLQILTRIPDQFKKGNNRLLLLQAVFDDCHNISSAKASEKIIDDYHKNVFDREAVSDERKLKNVCIRDFKPLSILKRKFEDEHAILQKIAFLPEVPHQVFLEQEITDEENKTKDFSTQLIENENTFHIGALIKRIWSGLNIPLHAAMASQQPLGGVSDLTNKGDFDRLLLSEFASDDLIFLSRLANNEALYIQREIPPANNNLQRVILLDVSLKNWGTPKTIAFAVMLAIAKHPKTDIDCMAFAVGDSYNPISLKNIDGLVQGLQILEGCLHAGKGLEAFYKDFPPDKSREIFFITEASTFKNPAALKILSDHQPAINYWVQTDHEGNIDVFKSKKGGKKHIQHLQLPLGRLWKKEPAPNEIIETEPRNLPRYPILFRNSLNSKKILSGPDGEIFQITGEKNLLRLYRKEGKIHEKGWEMVYENLPFVNGEYEIGLSDQGAYILLMFNPSDREITLLNLSSGEKTGVSFLKWKSTPPQNFVFHNQKFYHVNRNGSWSISLTGQINKEPLEDPNRIKTRIEELKVVASKFSYAQGVLKNIHSIYISEFNNLVFNIHELLLSNGHIKFNRILLKPKELNLTEATRSADNEFMFNDGSRIRINRSGMIILTSSDKQMPDVYIPSVLEETLGVATVHHYAGRSYYHKDALYEVILKSPGQNNILKVVRLVKESAQIGLAAAKDLVDQCPGLILKNITAAQAEEIKGKFNAEGAEIEIKQVYERNFFAERNKISTNDFFEQHIASFVHTIQANAAKN